MKYKIVIFVVLGCCVLGLSEQSIAVLCTQRAMMMYILALWLRCEWCVQNRDMEEARSKKEIVRENYELSQTVMNQSEQHRLLCEIRNTALKTLRYSKDTFAEMTFPSAIRLSSSSSSSQSTSVSTPESKPENIKEGRQNVVSPLVGTDNSLFRSKMALHRGSMSDSALSLLNDKQTKKVY